MKFFFLWFTFSLFAQETVTYQLSGGRFGDNLAAYLHAKWLAREKNIPLTYRPFPFSSLLTMDEQAGSFPDQEPLVCPYFPESKKERDAYPFSFDVDWNNEAFRKEALSMIAPKCPLSLIHPPSNTINIALHIREGGGFDSASERIQFPFKFPPLSFYLDSLSQLLTLFPGQSFYCHLFTDARHPEKIAEKIYASLPKNVPFYLNYRKKNRHDRHVLEDFFSLFHFDILIRSESNFSLIPSRLHDFAIVFSPTQTLETEVEISPELYEKLSSRKCTRWPKLAYWTKWFL